MSEPIPRLTNQDQNPTLEKRIISGMMKIIVEHILGQIEELFKNEKLDSIRTYGTFLKRTSAGKEVLVDTLVWPDEAGYRLAIIGKNKEAETISGIERISLTKAFGVENTQVAMGRIEVIEKNQKLAKTIDETLLTLLQEIANGGYGNIFNATPINIVWVVENYNALNVAELPTNPNGDKVLQKKIDDMKLQQIRWLDLYGKNGKLGLTPTDNNNFGFQKIIKPNNENPAVARTINEREYKKIVSSLNDILKNSD